jgi:hypothetical protein
MALERLILWKPLQKTTLVMYALVFLLAIPAPKAATLMLFGIVALWSRVPAMMTMFTRDTEVVDFFTVIIALHMGPLIAAFFGSGMILFSRIFGPLEDLDYTIKESILFFVGAFFSYYVYTWFGASIMVTMFSFTFIRYSLAPVLDLVTTPGKVFLTLIILTVSAPIAVISNLLLVNIFGESLDVIFAKGAVISWELLLFVTVIIVGFFLVSKFMFNEEQKRVESYGDDFAGGMTEVPEPHEAFFSMFTIPDVNPFLYVTPNLFKGFVTVIMFILILVASFQTGVNVSWLQMGFLFVSIFAMISLLIWVLNKTVVKKTLY